MPKSSHDRNRLSSASGNMKRGRVRRQTHVGWAYLPTVCSWLAAEVILGNRWARTDILRDHYAKCRAGSKTSTGVSCSPVGWAYSPTVCRLLERIGGRVRPPYITLGHRSTIRLWYGSLKLLTRRRKVRCHRNPSAPSAARRIGNTNHVGWVYSPTVYSRPAANDDGGRVHPPYSVRTSLAGGFDIRAARFVHSPTERPMSSKSIGAIRWPSHWQHQFRS
jgi:hypothetical protein